VRLDEVHLRVAVELSLAVGQLELDAVGAPQDKVRDLACR